MKFGFKYMQEEPEIIEETEELSEGFCIYCGAKTTLVVEHDSIVRLFVPVCRKHYSKFKAKEKSVERMTEAIKEFILA